MVEFGYLMSTVLMGAVLVITLVVLLGAGRWRRYSPEVDHAPSMSSRLDDSAVGTFGYLLLVVGFGVGGVLVLWLLSGASEGTGGALAVFALGGLGLIAAYLFWGIYRVSLSHGFHRAGATAMGLWTLGLLFIGAVVLNLLTVA